MFEIRSIMYKVAFKRYIGTSLRGGEEGEGGFIY